MLRGSDRDLKDATVFELGTGRRLLLPIGFWLLGAKRIVTVDLHPYLREELVALDLQYLRANERWFRKFFSRVDAEPARMDQLLALQTGKGVLKRAMELCGITYHPNTDAAITDLADGSIDLHVSNQVLEHIRRNKSRASWRRELGF